MINHKKIALGVSLSVIFKGIDFDAFIYLAMTNGIPDISFFSKSFGVTREKNKLKLRPIFLFR